MQALNELDFPDRLQKLLLAPQRIVCAELVITLDTGEIAAFNAWRVQHDNSRGPFKGGFRFHPTADVEEAKRLDHRHLTASNRQPRTTANTVCIQVFNLASRVFYRAAAHLSSNCELTGASIFIDH